MLLAPAPEKTLDQDVPPPGKALFRFSLVVTTLVLMTMKIGAMVTSTNSGMAFLTWPDADGYYLWPWGTELPGALEHGHRLLGALLGITAIALCVWVYRVDVRRSVRRGSVAFLVMIIIQGLLGGYRVLLDEWFPMLLPLVHGTFAQVVLCVGAYLAFALSPSWMSTSVEDTAQVRILRRLSALTLVSLFLQVLFGAWVRHTDHHYSFLVHIGFAAVVSLLMLITIGYSMGKFSRVPGFNRMNRIGLVVLGAQLLLGFVTLFIRVPKTEANTASMERAIVQTSHAMLGACLFVLATLIWARAHRNLQPRDERLAAQSRA